MNNKMITSILTEVLFDKSSEELDELALDLCINKDDALLNFCDRFDLGDWFYEKMIMLDIDIIDEVSVIADEHRKIEKDDLLDTEILRRELQAQSAL